jgi:tetratricopeptide (TPR) repeat protein
LPEQETTLATFSLTLEVYRQAIQGGLIAIAVEIFRYRLYPILFFRIGEWHTQVRMLEELVPAAKQCPEQVNPQTLAVLTTNLSTVCNLAGFPREGFRWATEAAALREPSDSNGTFEANRLVYLASSGMRLGKLQFAAEALEKSVAAQVRAGDRFREGIARLNLAWTLTYSARFDEAAANLDAADEIFRHIPKSRHSQCILLVHRARLELLSGDGTRALRHAHEAFTNAIEAGNETDLVRAQWALGAALVRRVEEDPTLRDTYLTKAEAHLVAALKKCSETHFGDFAMELHIALAHWHFANEDPGQAQQAAQSARALAQEGGHALKQAEAEEILLELARLAETRSIQRGAAAESTESRAASQPLAVWSLSSMPHVILLEPDPRS